MRNTHAPTSARDQRAGGRERDGDANVMASTMFGGEGPWPSARHAFGLASNRSRAIPARSPTPPRPQNVICVVDAIALLAR
jgi:hypothetical protein